jgi:hypothetical protein
MEIKLIDSIENPEKCIALKRIPHYALIKDIPCVLLSSVTSANEKVLYRSIQEILIEATEGSKKDLWHTSDKIPKKNRPLLLQLSNGMLVFGKFEGWGVFIFHSRTALQNRNC